MKANSKFEFDAESSIEKDDRFRAADGTVWKVLKPHDNEATEMMEATTAWLTDVDVPGRDRWMGISEIAAQLDAGEWTEVSE